MDAYVRKSEFIDKYNEFIKNHSEVKVSDVGEFSIHSISFPYNFLINIVDAGLNGANTMIEFAFCGETIKCCYIDATYNERISQWYSNKYQYKIAKFEKELGLDKIPEYENDSNLNDLKTEIDENVIRIMKR